MVEEKVEVEAYCKGVEAVCPNCGEHVEVDGWGYAEVSGVASGKPDIFKQIDEVYKGVDLTKYPESYFKFCVDVQFREIRLTTDPLRKANEWADIIAIAAHAIESLSLDPEKVIRDRISNHSSRVSDILEKYLKMYHFSISDLCSFCGKVIVEDSEIKFMVCKYCLAKREKGDDTKMVRTWSVEVPRK